MSRTTRHISKSRSGFTLAEVLAAMLFMAIVIPVAMRGLMIANRAGVVAERKGVAAELADQLLTDMVIGDAWETAADEGDFGDDHPGYAWTIASEAWEEDTMRLLRAEVFYSAQGQEFSVALATLVEEPSEDSDTEEEATP